MFSRKPREVMSGLVWPARGAARFDLRRALLALAVAGALGNGPRGDHARAHDVPRPTKRLMRERVSGEHEVRSPFAGSGIQLALKRGFELRLGKLTGTGEVWLRVARERAHADQIAPGFVPVGPTVEVSPAQGSAEVSFVADHFRVRAGHRLVLAVELAAPCSPGACWQLLAARYERGRCLARLAGELGRRMQFGSLPEP
jgi:hypothetical protein